MVDDDSLNPRKDFLGAEWPKVLGSVALARLSGEWTVVFRSLSRGVGVAALADARESNCKKLFRAFKTRRGRGVVSVSGDEILERGGRGILSNQADTRLTGDAWAIFDILV